MTGQHTPGPWWTEGRYDGREMGCAIIAARTDAGPLPGNPTRGMVGWASAMLNAEARTCEANARLIAAAPDLLEALEALRHAVCGETGFAACVRKDSGRAYPWPALDEAEAIVEAAIAKARGQE